MNDGKVPGLCDEISLQEREVLQKYQKLLDKHHRLVNEKDRLFRNQWHKLTENESSVEKMLNAVLKDMQAELPEEDMSEERFSRISDKIKFIHEEYLHVKRQLIEKSNNDALQNDASCPAKANNKNIVKVANVRPAGALSTSAERPAATTGKLSKKPNVQSSARAKPSISIPVDMVISEQDMSIISMQINKGQPTSICADCHVEVTNDYVGHKEHVIKRHIGGHTEGDRAAFISKFIQFCFPGSLVINDLQCCICGLEMQSNSGRRLHVGRQHSYTFVNCPVQFCTSVFSTIESANNHLRSSHRITCNDLHGPEKIEFDKHRMTYNHKVKLLLHHCFPYPVPSNKSLEDIDPAVDASLKAFVPPKRTEKTLIGLSADDDKEQGKQQTTVEDKSPQSVSQSNAAPKSSFGTSGTQCKAPMTSAAKTSTSQPGKKNTNANNASNVDDQNEEVQRQKRLRAIIQQIDEENKRNQGRLSFSLSNMRPYWEMQNGATLETNIEVREKPNAVVAGAGAGLDDSTDSDSGREVDILDVVGPGIGLRKPKLEVIEKVDKVTPSCVGKQWNPRCYNNGGNSKRCDDDQPSGNRGIKRRRDSANSSKGRGGCRHHRGGMVSRETSDYRPQKKNPLLRNPPTPESSTQTRPNNIENNRKKAGGCPHAAAKRSTQVEKQPQQTNPPYYKQVDIKTEVKEEC